MTPLQIMTVLGGLTILFGFILQINRLIKSKGDTRGVSLPFWVLSYTALYITLLNINNQESAIYLIAISTVVVIATSLIAIMVATYRIESIKSQPMTLKDRRTARGLDGVRILLIPITIIASFYVIYMPFELTQLTASIILIFAFFVQLVKLVGDQESEGWSVWMSILVATGLAIISFRMFIEEENVYIMFTELISVALLILCALFAHIVKK